MNKYIVDEHGKWEIQGNCKILIEPSEYYLAIIDLAEQQKLEKELLDSLKPTTESTLMAKIEINMLNLLLELEVI